MAVSQLTNDELDVIWNSVIDKMREHEYQQKNLYLKLSYGIKSMLLLFACIESDVKFTAVFGDTGRHSDDVLMHINNVNSLLRENGIEVVTIPCTCAKSFGDPGCPGIKAAIDYIDDRGGIGIGTLSDDGLRELIGTYGKYIMKFSDHPNLESFYEKHSNNKRRLNPLWECSTAIIFAMHDKFVPDAYKFPKNSVATCNSPICPSILALNPNVGTRYTDWGR